MLPAPGQGALAVTARAGDAPAAAAAARAVHHTATAVAVAAERAFLRTLEGGCQVPVAAHAALDARRAGSGCTGGSCRCGGERGVEGIETGAAATKSRPTSTGSSAGRAAAGRRRGVDPRGGARRDGAGRPGALMPATVLVTASAGTFPGLVEALRAIPVGVEEVPLMTFAPPLDWRPVDAAVRDLGRYAAVAFTSPRSAQAFAERVAWLAVPARSAARLPRPRSGRRARARRRRWASTLGEVRRPDEREVGKRGAAVALASAHRGGAARGGLERAGALSLRRHSPGRAAVPASRRRHRGRGGRLLPVGAGRRIETPGGRPSGCRSSWSPARAWPTCSRGPVRPASGRRCSRWARRPRRRRAPRAGRPPAWPNARPPRRSWPRVRALVLAR